MCLIPCTADSQWMEQRRGEVFSAIGALSVIQAAVFVVEQRVTSCNFILGVQCYTAERDRNSTVMQSLVVYILRH